MLGRLLLATIFFVCLAAIMVSLLQGQVVETSTDTETEETPASTPAGRAAPTTAVASVSPAPAPRIPGRTPLLNEGIPPLEVAPASPPTVAAESAPGPYIRDAAVVYSSNYGTGRVLTQVDQPVQVDRGISILNQEGWWVEVRIAPRTTGFVRSEDLVDD
jgi:hypothetical protein